MKLSVVIATYNRAEVLRRNLLAFAEQVDLDFEVVVAIDGSSDHTTVMLTEMRDRLPYEVRWVDTQERERYCLGKARNRGILESSGEAVVVLDDDSFPVVEFVGEHKRSVRLKTLTGGYRNSHDPKDELHAKMKHQMKHSVPIEEVVENNSCMYRVDWIGCGMFAEYIVGYGGVGQEFRKRLAYQCYSYQFNPRAMVYHHREFEGDNGLTRDSKAQQHRANKDFLTRVLP